MAHILPCSGHRPALPFEERIDQQTIRPNSRAISYQRNNSTNNHKSTSDKALEAVWQSELSLKGLAAGNREWNKF
jgi:hypothetical protein